jgi:hypothetical protein
VLAMHAVEISALVARLARPHASGGVVIERAAILAAGTDFRAVMEWIVAHGQAETLTAAPARGLHGSGLNDRGATESRAPLRFVLPPGAGSPSRPATAAPDACAIDVSGVARPVRAVPPRGRGTTRCT